MRIEAGDALIVVDVQNDFCEGGRLAVPRGSEVVAPINAMLSRPDGFATVVLTQDWHPAGHGSFASSHPDAAPFSLIDMPYGPQVLWPDHCIQASDGAALRADLETRSATLLIRKGMNPAIDSYSAFRENDRRTETGLAGYLRDRGVGRVVVVGLALDYCVRFSATDAREYGFEAVVVEEACRAIDADGSLAAAREAFRDTGVQVVADLEG